MARCSSTWWNGIPNAEDALPNFHFFPWATKVLGLLRRNSRMFLTQIIQWVFLVFHLKMVWPFGWNFLKDSLQVFSLRGQRWVRITKTRSQGVIVGGGGLPQKRTEQLSWLSDPANTVRNVTAQDLQREPTFGTPLLLWFSSSHHVYYRT